MDASAVAAAGLEDMAAHRPLGWAPHDPKWRARLARRVVWTLSAQAAERVFVSAFLTVELGRARPRRPLVAATNGRVTRAGWTTEPPGLVVALDPRDAAWWLDRGTGEVWVLRAGGNAVVHRPRSTSTSRDGEITHRGYGLALDLALLG